MATAEWVRITFTLTNKILGISAAPDPVLSADPRKIAVYSMGPGWGFIQINCENNKWDKVYHNTWEISNNHRGKFGPKTTKIIYEDSKYFRDDATKLSSSYDGCNTAVYPHRATLSLSGEFSDRVKVLLIDGTIVIPSENIGKHELVCSDTEQSHFGKKQDYYFIKDGRKKVECENVHYPEKIKGYSFMINAKEEILEIRGIKFKLPSILTYNHYDNFNIYRHGDAYIIHLPKYASNHKYAASFLERL